VRAMGRETREVWKKRVERWENSGLTAEAFASRAGVRAATLRHWRWQFGAERRGWRAQSQSKPRFVEVVPSGLAGGPRGPEGFELVLAGGALLRIPARVESKALRQVVAVLAGAFGRRLLGEGR
jgi:transposase